MLFLLLLPSDFSLLSDISTNVPSSGEPWASQVELAVKNPPANAGDVRDVGSIPGLGRSPGGGHGRIPTPVFLPGEFHGQRSLEDYGP